MDGVFMLQFLKGIICLALVVSVIWMVTVFVDRQELDDAVIRLHVVADSDSEADQAVKLKVRDAVLTAMEENLTGAENKVQAQEVLHGCLPEIEAAANQVLKAEGVTDRATVTLMEEAFPTRQYDTFSLPAGVYDSLRVTIGSGEGKNWWCVVFPGLCVPTAVEEVEDVAVSAGFSLSLSGSITGEPQYQVRFFVLDWLGRVENFFHKG